MWQLVLILVGMVYIEVAMLFFGVKMLTKYIFKDGSNVPIARTAHVLKVVGIIYFIPIVALAVSLIYCHIAIGPIIFGILISVIPVTNGIIIPLSEKKYIKIAEKEYGKDSSMAKYIRKLHDKNNKEKETCLN